MSGYPRRGGEIRPAVSLCVAPENPTPSSGQQGGVTNGSLHFGDREGVTIYTSYRREEARLDLIRLLVNQTRGYPSGRSVTTQPDIFCASVRVVIQNDRVASVRPLPPITTTTSATTVEGFPAGYWSDSGDEFDQWVEPEGLSEEEDMDNWITDHLQ